jgi:hypothetical protein
MQRTGQSDTQCPCGAKLTHTDYLGRRYDGQPGYLTPEHKRLYVCRSCGRTAHAYCCYDAAREMAHDERLGTARRDVGPGGPGDQ